MEIRNQINSYKNQTTFGAILVDKAVERGLLARLSKEERREYRLLKKSELSNTFDIRLGQSKNSGKIYGEIWEPETSFIKFADYEEKNPLKLIKNLCEKAKPTVEANEHIDTKV